MYLLSLATFVVFDAGSNSDCTEPYLKNVTATVTKKRDIAAH